MNMLIIVGPPRKTKFLQIYVRSKSHLFVAVGDLQENPHHLSAFQKRPRQNRFSDRVGNRDVPLPDHKYHPHDCRSGEQGYDIGRVPRESLVGLLESGSQRQRREKDEGSAWNIQTTH